ncbi:MAG TPA: 2-aminoethylphosphonate--pyruvate transaminase [Candidatus Saccharimonadales bacterium]|nr:2-aminoethylphosphonate--pyruvate transaminase [Candidatus Saccharimonadales bacterium]
MDSRTEIPPARDKLLFTPGPLTTSLSVKLEMLHDAGSWHYEFNDIVRGIRQSLLKLAGISRADGYEAILMQGSGSFGVEAVLASVVPPQGKLLVLSNGAYGERMVQMASCLKIPCTVLRSPEDQIPNVVDLEKTLAADPSLSHVAAVHCETTTGILNPIQEIGRCVKSAGRSYIVDAMSSFGAIPIDFHTSQIDFLISSANKCIEGVPGFSFILGRRDPLLANEPHARSLCLSLAAQLKGFEKNGQFRYTPPTHALLAFAQALRELDQEGGILGRAARYQRNHEVLLAGMTRLGFKVVLPAAVQSYIISSFLYPADPKFVFQDFYQCLAQRGMLVYPGKLTQMDCFRIGTIGRLFENDIRSLVEAIQAVLIDMKISVPKP